MPDTRALMPAPKGWGYPGNADKAHYFIEGISLCRRWWFSGELEDARDDHSKNCVECKRKLKPLREAV